MKLRLISFAASVALCGMACLPALADNITVFNTGSNGSTALPVGTTDPHYSLVAAPPGVPLTAITTAPNAAWVPNQANADWISPGSSGNTNWPTGSYTYQTTFNLTAGENPATAILSGLWSSDNDSCIFLNGANTGQCIGAGSYASLIPFSITSGFVTGTNTLAFVVDNLGGPSGVIAEVSGTVSATPEPSSLLLLGTTGLAGIGMFYRRLRSAL